ncbi:hypothetical protein [Jannaschia formosa]|uniref:hypothetical protein n=1 Tax=Jannaschia formosa TaxID=2259592 RepID=UPI001431D5D6|nr:hypothetical protein [Jannaschia formosa]
MLDLPRPDTPQATLARLSDVQARMESLAREATALRAHLLRLSDAAPVRPEPPE